MLMIWRENSDWSLIALIDPDFCINYEILLSVILQLT